MPELGFYIYTSIVFTTMANNLETQAIKAIFPVKTTLNFAGCVVTPNTDAVSAFHKNGFLVIRGAMRGKALQDLLQRCVWLHKAVHEKDPRELGNRNPGRYSIGAITLMGHALHLDRFLAMLDVPVVYTILDWIYTGEGWVIRGVGGDYCTGWAAGHTHRYIYILYNKTKYT